MNFEANLLLILSDFLFKKDFDLILEKKLFRKEFDFGFQSIIPSVSLHQGEAFIEIHLGIRHHQVEELLVQFTNHPTIYQTDTHTIIASIGKLLGKKYFRYKAKTEEDLYQVGNEIQGFMDQEGFHFLNHTQLQKLNELVNAQPEQNSLYIYNNYHRCLRGIILAKMTHNLNFEQLGVIYLKRLKVLAVPDEQIQSFKRLVSFLAKFSFN